MMGVSPERAAEALASLGARIVGGNCGNGPHEIGPVMTQMAQRRPSGVHLIAQSNAGMPQLHGSEFHYDGTPEVMAEYAVQMRELGVGRDRRVLRLDAGARGRDARRARPRPTAPGCLNGETPVPDANVSRPPARVEAPTKLRQVEALLRFCGS